MMHITEAAIPYREPKIVRLGNWALRTKYGAPPPPPNKTIQLEADNQTKQF